MLIVAADFDNNNCVVNTKDFFAQKIEKINLFS